MMIIVAGLPGSGKSFFAVRLADRVGAQYINSDKVRNALKKRGQYSLSDKFKVYREMVQLAEEGLQKKLPIVVDATFYLRSIRDMFYDLAGKWGVPVFLIEIIAKENLIQKRLRQDRKDSQADFLVYQKVKEAFELIGRPHLILKSTDDNIEQLLEDALQYVGVTYGK
ncbi:ATP-binding protein [Echinicola jeungdonensis]|uniref:AAA family ATPase n=1 Tax=Echinicola jeungdonensis TaxID=709343 RepID=A0ABV5JB72_9BACT|nr:ATP-binding protein [Echinicola jeungdonensis]MDN3670532.1 ATP-binding protein [Echinicola jeungdonensis]